MLFTQNANYIRNEDLSIVYSSASGKDEGTRMSMFRKGLIFAASIITITALPLAQIPVMAMEGGTEAFESVMLPTIKEEIISVDLPTVGDESPFDFYIDPQGLLYDTGAVRHGGGVVEEGAYLLFHNHDDGDYDFSGRSDRLKVTNRSTVPVNITITAKISDLGDLRMDQDGSFEDEDDCAIYLAIVDDEGNERVLSEDGEVSVEVELSSAPSEAYTFRYDESTDTYEYVYQNDEDISFDSYSFGLRGVCNANSDWSGISASPRVMVTWSVDPVMPDRPEETDEDIEKEASEEISDEQDLEDVSEEVEEPATDDEEKDANTEGNDNSAAENTDTSDVINDNADTSSSDTDKATDDQTDTESDDKKGDDSSVNPDDSGEAKETSYEGTANEGITTGDSDTGSTAVTVETQG